MNGEYQLTIDSLIKDELDGKIAAISLYDGMIWKIRTGYAVFIYGTVGIIVGLVNQGIVKLNILTVLSLSTLILGFSVFALLLDFSFLKSKLLVVKYRDELTELTFKKTKNGDLTTSEWERLLKCLRISGELREEIDWSESAASRRPFTYYGGTCLVCFIASWLLMICF